MTWTIQVYYGAPPNTVTWHFNFLPYGGSGSPQPWQTFTNTGSSIGPPTFPDIVYNPIPNGSYGGTYVLDHVDIRDEVDGLSTTSYIGLSKLCIF